MNRYLASIVLFLVTAAYGGWHLVLAPFDGAGPGAVAPPGVRENPASWRAVYVPYVVSHGSGGGGGYSLGK